MNTGLSWHADALCAQTDPEAHYPEAGGTAAPAKRTCMACPVRAACLEHAIEAGEEHGVWGGVASKNSADSSGHGEQNSRPHNNGGPPHGGPPQGVAHTTKPRRGGGEEGTCQSDARYLAKARASPRTRAF